jgi:FKBP-type peptidyl-prolyl cis-trans isomerase
LQYEVVKAGEGPFPALTDKVKVHYEGFLLDGTKFDSSIDRGKPIEFALNRVIKGWAEGVALMQPGAKYTLYIPYELGYGAQGAGNVVKPYSALIFEVELIEIVK